MIKASEYISYSIQDTTWIYRMIEKVKSYSNQLCLKIMIKIHYKEKDM